jgi:hypothetical protein
LEQRVETSNNPDAQNFLASRAVTVESPESQMGITEDQPGLEPGSEAYYAQQRKEIAEEMGVTNTEVNWIVDGSELQGVFIDLQHWKTGQGTVKAVQIAVVPNYMRAKDGLQWYIWLNYTGSHGRMVTTLAPGTTNTKARVLKKTSAKLTELGYKQLVTED